MVLKKQLDPQKRLLKLLDLYRLDIEHIKKQLDEIKTLIIQTS